MVNENRVCSHRLEGTVRTNGDFTQVVVITDAAEHQRSVAGRSGRRLRHLTAMGCRPGLCLGLAAVVDGDRMTGLDQVPCHGPTHDASTDKCKFHQISPEQ